MKGIDLLIAELEKTKKELHLEKKYAGQSRLLPSFSEPEGDKIIVGLRSAELEDDDVYAQREQDGYADGQSRDKKLFHSLQTMRRQKSCCLESQPGAAAGAVVDGE